MNLYTYYNNFVSTGTTFTVPTSSTRIQKFFDYGSDSTVHHRNVAVAIIWNSNENAIVYEWQPSFILTPEDTGDRPTDWQDGGTLGYKFVHGCRITADTGGIPRTVQIQYDGGINGPVLTVNHNGQLTLPYSFVPFKAHFVRLLPTDSNLWRLWGVEWEVDAEPESTGYWVTQPTTFEMPGYSP